MAPSHGHHSCFDPAVPTLDLDHQMNGYFGGFCPVYVCVWLYAGLVVYWMNFELASHAFLLQCFVAGAVAAADRDV